jgi:hypothetical protein
MSSSQYAITLWSSRVKYRYCMVWYGMVWSTLKDTNIYMVVVVVVVVYGHAFHSKIGYASLMHTII